MKRIALGLLASVMAIAATAAMAQSKPPLKLGAILDMSGLYADITGVGSETAAKMPKARAALSPTIIIKAEATTASKSALRSYFLFLLGLLLTCGGEREAEEESY